MDPASRAGFRVEGTMDEAGKGANQASGSSTPSVFGSIQVFLVVAIPRGINEIIEDKSYKAGDEESGGVLLGALSGACKSIQLYRREGSGFHHSFKSKRYSELSGGAMKSATPDEPPIEQVKEEMKLEDLSRRLSKKAPG